MRDRCGVDIEVGASVDVYLDGRFTANVAEVRQGGLAGADGKIEPAYLLLIIPVPFKYHPDQPAECYVIRQAPKPEPETEEKPAKKKLRLM